MGKRTTSGAVLAAMPLRGSPMSHSESRDVSIRQIDNGYVTRVSEYKGDKYTSSEVFSKERPSLAPVNDTNPGGEALRDAVKSLK